METLVKPENSMQAEPTYLIDGSKIHSWQDFVASINAFIPDADWQGNSLDALDDILSGGYGTPDRFVIYWTDVAASRQALDQEAPNYSYDNKTLSETLLEIFNSHDNITLHLE